MLDGVPRGHLCAVIIIKFGTPARHKQNQEGMLPNADGRIAAVPGCLGDGGGGGEDWTWADGEERKWRRAWVQRGG